MLQARAGGNKGGHNSATAAKEEVAEVGLQLLEDPIQLLCLRRGCDLRREGSECSRSREGGGRDRRLRAKIWRGKRKGGEAKPGKKSESGGGAEPTRDWTTKLAIGWRHISYVCPLKARA